MPRRTIWQLLLAAGLLLLLTTLATLQYRWLGQVSDAERDRLRSGLSTRASAFADDFNREITRVYTTFQGAAAGLNEDDPAALLSEAAARAADPGPALVRDVYLFDPEAKRDRLTHLDPARRTLDPTEWPVALDGLRRRAENLEPPALPGKAIFLTDVIDAAIPAFIMPMPRLRRVEASGRVSIAADPLAGARMLIVVLDAGRLQHQVLEPLVAKHFGDPDRSEYYVTIVSRDDPQHVVFASSPYAVVDARSADVSAGMFDLRMNDVHYAVADRDAGHAARIEKFAITIVRRATGAAGARMLMTGGGQGAWELLVRGRSGSLEALVAKSRRRNLAISVGVLALLAVSMVLALGSAQRQQRLARQQMDFVAAVSHELRTPLAVICSAGENLADGVVADTQQVKRYGTLVETEGRRLADMVERVMEFAGILSGTARPPFVQVDLARVIADAVGGVSADARERGVCIAVRAEAELPAVSGDAEALRSAVQNLVGNAVKYSAADGTVDVSTRVNGTVVCIRVADRGLGIDTRDLPHIFEPFFRGRRALEAQVRGSGIGLSVARHVVDAHRGRIHVESRVGEGTTMTVDLPIAPGGGAPVQAHEAP